MSEYSTSLASSPNNAGDESLERRAYVSTRTRVHVRGREY